MDLNALYKIVIACALTQPAYAVEFDHSKKDTMRIEYAFLDKDDDVKKKKKKGKKLAEKGKKKKKGFFSKVFGSK